jgi:hypothetical protein
MNSVQSLREQHDVQRKLAALEGLMAEQGIDAAALFKEAGLIEDDTSTGTKDASRIRVIPRHAEERLSSTAGQSTSSSGPGSGLVSGSGSFTRGNLQPVMEISAESNETTAPENKASAIEPTLSS